jgi:predicted HTH transcriptional regulator
MLKEWLQGVLGRGRRDDDIERKLRPYLAVGNACTILRFILENPGITATSLAGRTHIDEGTVDACLDKLADDGIIVAENEGGQAGYHVAGDAKAAVAEHLPLNYQCPGMLRE